MMLQFYYGEKGKKVSEEPMGTGRFRMISLANRPKICAEMKLPYSVKKKKDVFLMGQKTAKTIVSVNICLFNVDLNEFYSPFNSMKNLTAGSLNSSGDRMLGALLPGASLLGASLPGASLPGASLQEHRLPGASLPGMSLQGLRCQILPFLLHGSLQLLSLR